MNEPRAPFPSHTSSATKMSPGGFRIPPQDAENEKALLGSIMLKPGALYEIEDLVNADSFYAVKHRIITEAMMDLHRKNEPIDLLSLASRLAEKKQLDTVGGRTYLAELVNLVPSASNLTHYAGIVQKKYILRKLIEAADTIGELGYNESADIGETLDSAEKKIFGIASLTSSRNYPSLKDGLGEAFERLDRLHKTKGGIRGVPTGFKRLDNLLSGLQNSDLVILAARLSKAPIFINDTPGNPLLQIRSVARRLKSEHKIRLIIVDYLQLVTPPRNYESMVQQVTEISRGLKGIARELDVPVLALSQLSRAVEQRRDRPRLSDLRDSGALEQDADVVMFIHREDRYKEAEER